MKQHTCIPPPPTEPPRDINDSESEEEAIDPTVLAVRQALHEEISFRQPSPSPIIPDYPKAEGKKKVTEKKFLHAGLVE